MLVGLTVGLTYKFGCFACRGCFLVFADRLVGKLGCFEWRRLVGFTVGLVCKLSCSEGGVFSGVSSWFGKVSLVALKGTRFVMSTVGLIC